jgi:hypothetical protein
MEAAFSPSLQLDWVRALPAYQAALRAALGGYLDRPRRLLAFLRRPANWGNATRALLGPLGNAARELLLLEAPACDALSRLVAAARALLTRGHVREQEFAEVVAMGYRVADELFAALPGDGLDCQDLVAPEPIDPRDYQREASAYLGPVLGLDRFAKRALKPDLAGFFLHGSLATLDYSRDYSDLDTLMVLKRGTVTEAGHLAAFLRRYRRSLTLLYRFDPLQHHGHIVVTEIDLAFYPNLFFPLPVLEYARSLGGAWGRLAVRYRDDRAEMRAEFRRVCDVFAHRAADDYRPGDAYALKEFLSELMLLPALYCQCTGNPCYKRFSFGRARRDFSAGEWRVIEEATRVRSVWRYGPKAGGWRSWAGKGLGWPEGLKAAGENRSSPVMGQARRLLSPGYVQAAGRLAQAMWRRVEAFGD